MGKTSHNRLLFWAVLFCLTGGGLEGRLPAWQFGDDAGFAGWQPNSLIKNPAVEKDCVSFETSGSDPIITSPPLELAIATNSQWVELDLEASGPGQGEFFFTNKTTGRYGGFESHLRCPMAIPAAGRQIVRIWPFWQGLGKIVRIRWDPPTGLKCRLFSVRIVSPQGAAPEPVWDFKNGAGSWQPMHNAKINHAGGRMQAKAFKPEALIITPVKPFKAEDRSRLHLKAACPGEETVSLYWVTEERPGLTGVPIRLTDAAMDRPLDLRKFPTWQGTVTQLALGFGTFGKETLSLSAMAIRKNDPEAPFLRVLEFGFDDVINRPGKPAVLRVTLAHAGGPALSGANAVLRRPRQDLARIKLPALTRGKRFTFKANLSATETKHLNVSLEVNNQTFRQVLEFDEAIPPDVLKKAQSQRGDYPVPPPRKVPSKYNIGIYYFPGWSPDQLSRWEKQKNFPERDPVLGWYAEGQPEVADWHIKWAVENGIGFFIYDWYWRNGAEELGAGLNEGFLKARYNGQMKFAIMWANHKPFSDHTPDQLMTVLDYWIKHYFKRKNYLTVEDKPYVSFFLPNELITCLGSETKVRSAFQAMRERAKAAGLAGLHLAACQGIDRHQLESLRAAGFDSVTGYNYLETGALTDHCAYRPFLLGHKAIWRRIESAKALPHIPCLTVGWDARPWHGPYTKRKFARSSRHFQEGLACLKGHLDETGKTMAILEAWNEWGEGSYIEPNRSHGFRDLEAIRTVFCAPGRRPVNIAPQDLGFGAPYDQRRISRTDD